MDNSPEPSGRSGEGDQPCSPHGTVVIVLPDDIGGLPTSVSVAEEAVALLHRAGAVGGDAAASNAEDAGRREEEERPRPRFSLWRAAGAALALAALAVAGYVCLYADGHAGAAWRFLALREEEWGDRRSFLLPLYPKARAGGVRAGGSDGAPQNLTAAIFPLSDHVFPDGQYYTTMSIGNPPRSYFLDVDTGSDFTWIQCDAPCRNCAKGPHPLYKPARGNIIPSSDSFCQEFPGNLKPGGTSNQCDYDLTYADGSSSMGVLARDSMQLISEDGERENLDIVFGCGYDQQGNLLASLTNTDGALGLSSAAISLPTQLARQGTISNVFGHCMTTDPSGVGYLFLGDDYIPRWGMTWVPIRNGPNNIYSTEVEKVNYGDQHRSVRGLSEKLTRVIFDSGSTYMYFPREAYTNLIAVLKDASPRFVQDDSDKTLPFCMKADFPVRSVDDVKQLFKPLILQFKKSLFIFTRTFTMSPEDYLIITDKGNVCLGVLDGTEVGFGSAIVLGDVSLRGKLIVYDNDENKIAWVQSDCTNPHKQSRLPFFLRKALRNQFL
ncbi:aspartyl protease APCB1-like [Phragmites australis]|uniref:aspartyl protease APCB1-like n=1 Tax=Phragmites australis TaxID=29695 RepID=UPI002D79FB12|nr:aspartyl protease APCB1-like [Phragmites australis]